MNLYEKPGKKDDRRFKSVGLLVIKGSGFVSYGSAVLIESDLIITADHNFANNEGFLEAEFYPNFPEPKRRVVKVSEVYRNKNYVQSRKTSDDFALARLEEGVGGICFPGIKASESGSVTVVGYPSAFPYIGGERMFAPGSFSRPYLEPIIVSEGTFLSAGMSGGGWFDENGDLVGITSSKFGQEQNTASAILDETIIRNLLNKNTYV